MSKYALISDWIVVNTVIWDGNGSIFSEFTTVEITESVPAEIGDAYINDTLYQKPRDGYDYDFDTENLAWVITAENATQKAKDQAADNIVIAESEYDRASDKIDALNDQIEDEDYSDTDTEETVKAAKTSWTTYRKSLRAYIAAADGTATLPTAPDV